MFVDTRFDATLATKFGATVDARIDTRLDATQNPTLGATLDATFGATLGATLDVTVNRRVEHDKTKDGESHYKYPVQQYILMGSAFDVGV